VHSSLFVANSTVIQVEALRNRAGTVVTGATVRLQSLADERGNAVFGVTTPLAIPHIEAGTYEVTLSPDLVITPGRLYRAVITAEDAGLTAQWTEDLIAKVRNA
jgi:hypothetical protein